MIYSPRVVEPVEVEFVILKGRELAVVCIDDAAHVIDSNVFELLFEATEEATKEAKRRLAAPAPANPRAKRRVS